MDVDTEISNFDEDSIEPCRTCGVFFTKSQDLGSAIVKPIFSPILQDTDKEKDMPDILQQLRDWNMEVAQDDGRPQYICIVCIAQFRKVLKFKRSCLEAQQQYQELEIRPFDLEIKKEIDIPSEQEEKFVGFIYLSDEDSSEEDGSTRVRAAFDIPHVPIKEEHMARVPEPVVYSPPQLELPTKASFSEGESLIDDKSDVVAIDDESNGDEDNDQEDIIKFTYDDIGANEANLVLPQPLAESRVFCKLCSYESSNQDQHMDHMRRVHMLKDCECHICGKKFANAPESRLKFHMKWHKLQRHLKCPICGFFCNSKDALKEHNLAVHSRTKCQFCGKRIKQKMLQNHINLHLQEREAELALKLTETTTTAVSSAATNFSSFIQCAFCEGTFETAQDLQNHVLATHKSLKKESLPTPLPSSIFPMETDGEYELNASVDQPETLPNSNNKSHTHLSRSASPQTGVILESASTSTFSSSTNMSSCTKSIYNCPVCGKSFNLKIKLNRHFRKHDEEPF